MRYYLHLATENGSIRDTEGSEFPNLEAAGNEALQVARDLIAEELRQGRPAPSRWELWVAHEDGTIRLRIPLRSLVEKPSLAEQTDALRHQTKVNVELRARTRAITQATRSLNQETRALMSEIRERLRSV